MSAFENENDLSGDVLRYDHSELPLIHQMEEPLEDDSESLITGEKQVSFNQFRWLPLWLNWLGLAQEAKLWRPLATTSILLIWTIWQCIVQFWIGLEVKQTVGDQVHVTIQSIGNPIWPLTSLYGLISFCFLFWYMRHHKKHFNTLINKKLQVEEKTEKNVNNKILRNLILVVVASSCWLIVSIVKSIIALVSYGNTGQVPYNTMRNIPAIFVLHALIEPLAQVLTAICIFSCFLITDVLGWVHAVEIRIFCSQLIYAARSTNQPGASIPIAFLLNNTRPSEET